MTDEETAIEAFFLKSGKWELEIGPEGQSNIIGGRWLWNSDSNYGFRPIDLLAAIRAAGQSTGT